jgi:predicted CopG family antitoxin
MSKMLTKKEREQLDILAKHTERLSESEIKQLHAQEY